MRTRPRRTTVAALAAGLLALGALGGAAPVRATVPAKNAPIIVDSPPTRIIIASDADAARTGGTAVAADGTVYVLRRPELHVFAPSAHGQAVPIKAITGLPSSSLLPPSLDPARGLAIVVSDPQPGVVVVDPDQPAGAAQPLRTIAGSGTRIGYPMGASWAPDGSLWVVDRDNDGGGSIELLRFAPGADGNVPPDRVLSGPLTGLDNIAGFTGPTVDVLADGSAVVGAIGVNPGVLVFEPHQDGDVAPARQLRPALTSPGFAQYGAAADARGRLLVSMGPPQGGTDWGAVAVYPVGASGNASPLYRLTGPGTGLHTPLLPTSSPAGVLTVTDAMFVAGTLISVRLLDFADLPVPPSTPRRLRATRRGASTKLAWQRPADHGNARVTEYRVAIRKGGRVVHRAKVGGAATSYTVRSRVLPAGRLTVGVAASNVAGSGPEATAPLRNPAARRHPQP